MAFQKIKTAVNNGRRKTFKVVNKLAETERFIALLLMFIPLILMAADFGANGKFRSSISNYAYMCDSYWFGSLLALAGALFIFNGAQHMQGKQIQQNEQEFLKSQSLIREAEQTHNPMERFGKGYNIIFGIALFGVILFDHLTFFYTHLVMTITFYVGCALAMLFGYRKELKFLGISLGALTLISLGIHFMLNYIYCRQLFEYCKGGEHPYTLLFAEWIGLIFIAIYFFIDSFYANKPPDLNYTEEDPEYLE